MMHGHKSLNKTLKLCNTHRFSAATMVARTRLKCYVVRAFPALLWPRRSVYCAVRTEPLNTTEDSFRLSSFNTWIEWGKEHKSAQYIAVSCIYMAQHEVPQSCSDTQWHTLHTRVFTRAEQSCHGFDVVFKRHTWLILIQEPNLTGYLRSNDMRRSLN